LVVVGFVVPLFALVAPAVVAVEPDVDFDVEAMERVLRDEPFDFPPPTGSAPPAALTALPAVLPTSPTARPTVLVTFLMILPGSGIGSPSRSRRREWTACRQG
jgi:hypothetical protein